MKSTLSGSLRLPICAAVATITATLCLGTTFLSGTWFFPSLFAVVLVGVGAEVARRMSASRLGVPVGGAIALLLYLLVRYGHQEAWFHLVPTVGSLERVGDLVAAGRVDVARYAAPIGVSPGIEVITVGGVGLVALAVDTLAVTLRRAALAGLPLLVLYTVPTSLAPDGVSWVAFAIAGIGFLTLLLAESRERVSRWGRPMRQTAPRANWRPEVDPSPLGQVGRRVGATALGLALVVPALLPDVRVTSFGFGSGGFGTGGGGGNRVSVVNPILDLGKDLRRSEDEPVISYRGRPTYLRLVGLDEFTGDQWRPTALTVSRDDNDVEDGMRLPPGLGPVVDRTSSRYRIDVFDLAQTWLPLPYPSRRVSIDGTWLYDQSTFNVFGDNSSTQGLSYRVQALQVRPTPEDLRGAPKASGALDRYLELPDDLPDVVEVRARDVIGQQDNDYDRALALQEWLRGDDFAYSTEVSNTVGDGNGSAAIARFLEAGEGYCVHFASTMAVMARTLDIPARVAVGFTAGVPDGNGGRTVGLHDAHAWPELYFEGTGWVAFEPTPGQRTGSPPPWARPEAAGGAGGPETNPTATPGATGTTGPDSPRNRERTDVPGFQEEQTGGGGGIGAGPVRIPVIPFLIGLGVLALLAIPAVTRVVVRRRRWRGAGSPAELARAAWAELQDTLVDYGYQWRSSDPPRAGSVRLVESRGLAGETGEAVHRLARATERARYAPSMTEVGDLRADTDRVRSGLAERATRVQRWRARLLPRSTRAISTAISERLADGLDAVDAVVAGLTRRLGLRTR